MDTPYLCAVISILPFVFKDSAIDGGFFGTVPHTIHGSLLSEACVETISAMVIGFAIVH